MVVSATRNSMIVNICTAISYLQDTKNFFDTYNFPRIHLPLIINRECL